MRIYSKSATKKKIKLQSMHKIQSSNLQIDNSNLHNQYSKIIRWLQKKTNILTTAMPSVRPTHHEHCKRQKVNDYASPASRTVSLQLTQLSGNCRVSA